MTIRPSLRGQGAAGVGAPARRPVGIGELLTGSAAEGVLSVHGLGSCIALTAWDPIARIGGLAHFMLPSGDRPGKSARYVDTGVPGLLEALQVAGASPRRMRFKAAGGAAMLSGVGGSLEIGRRNIAVLHQTMQAAGLRLEAQDLGGNRGRSLELDLVTGTLTIKTISGWSVL